MEGLMSSLRALGGGADGEEDMDAQAVQKLLEQIQQFGGNEENMPQELKEMLQGMQQGKASLAASDTPTEEITPEPGFVVKTADMATGQKVFVNMVGHPKVAAPGNWGGGLMPEEVQKALDNIDNLSNAQAETLRFPLSMSLQRGEQDKKGEAVAVYDCCLNQDVIHMCTAHRPLKVFIIELALNWINHKHKTQLCNKFKLPRMRYKGDVVEVHRIRVDRKQLVTQVRDVPDEPTFPLVTRKLAPGRVLSSAGKAVAGVGAEGTAQHTSQPGPSSGSQGSGGQTPSGASAGTHTSASLTSFRLLAPIQYIGRPVTAVRLDVEVPTGLLAQALKTSSGGPVGEGNAEAQLMRCVGVEVCGNQVWVGSAGFGELHVRLPLAVDAQGATAQLDAGTQPLPVLQLLLPYLPAGQLVKRAISQAPHALGTLGLSSAAAMELEP